MEPELKKHRSNDTLEGETSPSMSGSDLKTDELLCIVCRELPEDGIIYQCRNGHLLCSSCHHRVVEDSKSSCPTCRVHMSRDNPSRNRFAENILSSVYVPCSNAGCTEKVSFGKLKSHMKEKCGLRKAVCKFALIGCDWTGVQSQLKDHEKECPIKSKSPKKILKIVKAMKAKELEDRQVELDARKVESEIVKMMSSRVRDVVIRDVHLEKDEVCDEICSKTFMALGYAWEVLLEKEKATKKPAIKIRIVSSLRRKLPVSFFILPGPFMQMNVRPMLTHIDFKPRSRHQDVVCVYSVDEETTKRLLETESLHIRIGFVDRSRGVSHWFSNVSQTPADSGESSEESNSDFDDPDEDNDSDWDHFHDHDDDDMSDISITII